MNKLLLPLLFVTFGSNVGLAQTFASDLTVSKIYAEEDTAGIGEEGLDMVPASFIVTFELTNSSVTSITAWMGMDAGSNDLLDITLDITSSNSNTDGTGVAVNGDTIEINMGVYTGLSEFELKLFGLDYQHEVLDQVMASYPQN